MSKPKRQLRNFLIEPEIQLRRAWYFLAFFVTLMGGIVFWIYFQLLVSVELLASEYQTVALHVVELLHSLSWFAIAGYLLSGCIFSIIFGIYSSHRVIGPSVAIKNHIERLKKGDYSEDLKIRQGDELVTVARCLNELTDVLRQKQKK